MTDTKITKPIKLAIAAMGGQGGGVLSSWLVALAEQNNYLAQYTSVPGVAQRTGATIYYLEFFPKDLAQKAGKPPVMALMPVSGDVDIVVAGELVEAGRALTRGLVTPEQTTLISSTHRLYSQQEKQSLGDGRGDSNLITTAAKEQSKQFVSFDMNEIAIEQGSVISSVLYGALAGVDVLPFSKEQFQDVIRQGGFAVEANLAGFEAGYQNAQACLSPQTNEVSEQVQATEFTMPSSNNATAQTLLDNIEKNFDSSCWEFLVEGVKRLIDYQDIKYAQQYLQSMQDMRAHEQGLELSQGKNHELTRETARHLALWMSYEDTIRVADLKTRKQRFERYRKQATVKADGMAHVVEFMHPRVEEIADTLPAPIGKLVMNFKPLNKFINLFCTDRQIHTSKLSGFLLLNGLAKFRKIRRSSYRYKREHQRINQWLELIKQTSKDDYSSAVQVTKSQRLIKGYGDTLERGWDNYTTIIQKLPAILQKDNSAQKLDALIEAALVDDTGVPLQAKLNEILA